MSAGRRGQWGKPQRRRRCGEQSGTARQIAVEATSPAPPEVADAAVGADEKKSEVDAVDADNLTEILDRLSPGLTPKTK